MWRFATDVWVRWGFHRQTRSWRVLDAIELDPVDGFCHGYVDITCVVPRDWKLDVREPDWRKSGSMWQVFCPKGVTEVQPGRIFKAKVINLRTKVGKT